jgi:PAS domain S-box-containing protein
MKPDTGTPRDDDGEDKTGESLRRRAEKRMGKTAGARPLAVTKEEMQKIIHELQVHQIELEIQNEELVRTRDEVEAGLERYTELYDFAPVGYFTLDRTGTIRNVNFTGATLLGIERSHLLKEHFIRFVSDASRPAFTTVFSAAFEHDTKSSCEAEIRPKGNPPIHVMIGMKVFNKGRECLMVLQDITARKLSEEKLIKFSEGLERMVVDRTAKITDINQKLVAEIAIRLEAEKQLTKTVGEKEVLLREVHHRVKNNLQIIISLLNLQSRYITDETTLSAFRESQTRVRAMALVHEKLYQSTDLAKIDLDNYIRFLANSLFQFFGIKGKGITLTNDIRDVFLAIDTAIPIGLVINELISNSLKYAFPEGEGEISIAIHRQDHTLTILFKDNGIGIPEDFDWRNAKSMGLRLVITLVDQLDGTIELDRTAGTAFTIVVNEKE